MVQYKLYYFNFRGRAELIRLVFAAAGEQYEDVRIEFNDWPTYKARSPSGQAPFLEVVDGDKTLTLVQSVAIARHLARRFNLAGKDEQEQVIVDMYADQVSDWFYDIVDVIFHEKDEARKKQSAEKLEKETTPNACSIFEKHLSKSSSGFFADSGLTYADLYAVTVMEYMGDKKEAVLANYPHLKKMDEQVRAHPRVAEWIEKRPKTDG